MSGFCCPSCGQILKPEERRYLCPNGHSYDRAKSGYVNLLPPNAKHSKDPGDNKLMVNARREFLSAGFYQPLSDRICETAGRCLRTTGEKRPVLLDAGCGEGYYTGRLFAFLQQRGIEARLYGVDISKTAVDKAAKQIKDVAFAVGSVFHLPMAAGSCQMSLNLFAPFCREEIERVLCPKGYFVMAIPGERHLWELKEAVYERPYPNEVKDFALDGFSLLEQNKVESVLSLKSPHLIDCLFKMTPYYYKTSREDQARLASLQELTVTAQFHLLTYQKQK